jgi:hypothetical protein
LRLTLSFDSYPFDSESAIFYGIISDSVENEAQAFNISRRLLHIFQMHFGPEIWKNGVSHGNQRTYLDLEGKKMAHLFDIICQNFESNLDSILGLHEDISIRQVVGPTYLEEICSAWKEFLDSLPTPRLVEGVPRQLAYAAACSASALENELGRPPSRETTRRCGIFPTLSTLVQEFSQGRVDGFKP